MQRAAVFCSVVINHLSAVFNGISSVPILSKEFSLWCGALFAALCQEWFPNDTVANKTIVHHRVQNDSGVHTASYPMCTRGSLLGGKASGA